MTSFEFVRQKAGEYKITKNGQFVGSIKKASASKWIVTDVVDTPQHVTKTLKEAKDACINLIIFDGVDKVSETKYNSFVADNETIQNSLYNTEPTLEPIVF
jgi:hypothetical protein